MDPGKISVKSLSSRLIRAPTFADMSPEDIDEDICETLGISEHEATMELHEVYHWMQELFGDDGDEQEFIEAVTAMIMATEDGAPPEDSV